ncbi:hypothetical protein C8A05DRAFT_19756 [Staphylotrichum tortipilum]|uniref:Uncharacterized protein n=1 Tax=Staphylotrichum tortipilum TaxID=2831512 RepID=A0AAN6RNT5_9PEZI|nr:hypothetical protein C8A05DRAFT_19756 [Staphylotrichum longicolle]
MLASTLAKRSVIPLVALLVLSSLLFFRFYHQRGWLINNPLATPPPVELVVASLKSEDTSWVHTHLPDWFRSVYVVDDPAARHTVPRNKGREAMVYLTHIIDAYDTLADTTVFVHAARFAWHNDDPDYDALPALRRLDPARVKAEGYVNLRCVLLLGCPVEIHPREDAASAEVRANGTHPDGRPLRANEVYEQAFRELMPGMDVPERVGVSCCSQFAVSREAVRAHPREEYVRWREWLLATLLADDLSGRVFEYMWHIIFGKDAVYCPSPAECYCNVYGLCGLKCTGMQCEGRYDLPKYSTLPNGWPRVGWSGEARPFSGPL